MIEAANSEAAKRIIAAKVKNGTLPDAPDGPIVARFNEKELARAIEYELRRSAVMGWTRITIHMTLEDAVHLMRFLQKGRNG